MRCPHCYGPVSLVRGLGKSQPQDKDRTFYRCLLCGADFVVTRGAPSSTEASPSDGRGIQLQPVWPRAMG